MKLEWTMTHWFLNSLFCCVRTSSFSPRCSKSCPACPTLVNHWSLCSRAYERLVAAHGEEPKLPGLPYTTRQLFWLSGAAVWCTAMRPETLKSRVLTDPHAPARYTLYIQTGVSIANYRQTNLSINTSIKSVFCFSVSLLFLKPTYLSHIFPFKFKFI